MSHRTNRMPAGRRHSRGGPRPAVAAVLAVLGAAAPGPARAADVRTPAILATPVRKAPLAANPGKVLAAMADHLDKDPDLILLRLDTTTITQSEVAAAIRAMPPAMGSLEFQDAYRRALDVVARQKAMVLHAKAEHLDKDPNVLRQRDQAYDRVLAEAWLARKADAAVTDQVLRDRFDREVAGHPGPEQVHARVIMVATEDEARSLIVRLQGGADFAELARLSSKDPTAAKGGDLGWLTRDAVAPELAAAMFALAPGQLAAYPIGTIVGYFVVRIDGRQSLAPLGFEEARAGLVREIRSDAIREAVGSLLTNIKFVTAGTDGEKRP